MKRWGIFAFSFQSGAIIRERERVREREVVEIGAGRNEIGRRWQRRRGVKSEWTGEEF